MRSIVLVFLVSTVAALLGGACDAAAPASRPRADAAVLDAASAPSSHEPRRFSLSDPEIDHVVAGLQAAVAAHDARLARSFRDELAGLVGRDALDQADAEYRQLLGNAHAASAASDAKARAEFRIRLRNVCAPDSLTAAIERCDADLRSLSD